MENMENREQEVRSAPLIPLSVSSLVELTADKKEMRDVLNYVRIENNGKQIRAVATNAHIIGILDVDAYSSDEYPAPIIASGNNTNILNNELAVWEDILLHKDTIKALEKTVNKKVKMDVVSDTLACVDKVDNSITLRNTDLKTETILTQRIHMESFPPYESILPTAPVVFDITIGLPVLEKLVNVMKKLEVETMKWSFFGQEKIFKITSKTKKGLGGKIEVYAMPVRIG